MGLLETDWPSEWPVQLGQSLSLSDLSGYLVLNHARLVLEQMAADTGIKLINTGNFSRKLAEQMAQEFRWPGSEPEVVRRFNKVLNEPDYAPLDFLHAVISLAIAGAIRNIALPATSAHRAQSCLH